MSIISTIVWLTLLLVDQSRLNRSELHGRVAEGRLTLGGGTDADLLDKNAMAHLNGKRFLVWNLGLDPAFVSPTETTCLT